MYDELQLDTLGDKKTALFLIMSDTDSTFNFLISMVYTQLFNLLCDKADDVYGGKLPIHVRCLIDECANIGQIPNLEKLVATIRSREISACLVLQARSQLKAIYKDNADTIVGNMDSQIFLGGSEPTTLKDLSEMLGKETIDAFMENLKKERVWMKSGAYLVIEQTEAMVVIDVNTGKSVDKHSFEEHLLRINSEAAVEVCRQLRLRNLSGIIVVDFINMKQPGSMDVIKDILEQELAKDSVPAAFVDVTKLSLVELTRKKIRKSLKEQLTK